MRIVKRYNAEHYLYKEEPDFKKAIKYLINSAEGRKYSNEYWNQLIDKVLKSEE